MNRGLFGIVDGALKAAVSTAQATADNARQMVLNRDPRLASLDAALAAGDTVHAAINKRIDDLPKPTTSSVQIEYRDGVAVPAVVSLLGLSATADVTLTWPNAFADTAYVVTPQVSTAVAGLLGKTGATVKSKTVTGCVVTVTTTALIAAGQATLSAVAYRKG
jgi:hypothetical protein